METLFHTVAYLSESPILFPAVIAAIFGYCIGVERQIKGHFAGQRTNALVCLGAAAFVAASLHIGLTDSSPSRVMSQVASGLGFLGAGVILKDGLKIHGLTTAATVWVSGAVGSICGTGHYRDAGIVTLLVILINLLKQHDTR